MPAQAGDVVITKLAREKDKYDGKEASIVAFKSTKIKVKMLEGPPTRSPSSHIYEKRTTLFMNKHVKAIGQPRVFRHQVHWSALTMFTLSQSCLFSIFYS